MKKRRSPFLIFLSCVLAVPTCALLIGELVVPPDIESDALTLLLRPWIAVGTLMGLARLILRPVLKLITAPLGCLTLGLFSLVIDLALFYASAHFVDSFQIPSFLYALLTVLLINALTSMAWERRGRR